MGCPGIVRLAEARQEYWRRKEHLTDVKHARSLEVRSGLLSLVRAYYLDSTMDGCGGTQLPRGSLVPVAPTWRWESLYIPPIRLPSLTPPRLHFN
jgi:hypothetical protein